MIAPSELSWGRLGSVELPPLRLLGPDDFLAVDRAEPHSDLVVDGHRVTRGDLWDIMREDPVLGLSPKESASSSGGLWQSNGIGARSGTEAFSSEAREP